ncbi:MAG: HAMP domain-containing protein [Candidatus Eisenbacteria bacterium]|nr:HAMP domain-containing protein [Candidatus Eisenbacteria bacterium]
MGRFRTQILLVLLVVALLPAIPAALTVRELVRRSLDPRMHKVLQEGATAGLDNTRAWVDRETASMREAIRGGTSLDTLDLALLTPAARLTLQALPDSSSPSRIVLDGRSMLVARQESSPGAVIWLSRDLSPELEASTEKLGRALRLLEVIRLERDDLIRSLVLTFVAIYGAILVAVLGLGLWLASRWTRPLVALGAAMERVAGGDLDSPAPVNPAGPLARLLTQFNATIARLREQQTELVRLEKASAWRDMARRLAHEIKNPLTPIQLAAQQLREGLPTVDERSRSLLIEGTSIIEEEVGGLRDLVDTFARFARLPEPSPRRAPVLELLCDAQALYPAEQVRIECAPEGLEGCFDPDEMHRVLINLIKNALEAQQTFGTLDPILVRGAQGPAGLEIEVLDRGPGVPASERGHIFEPNVSGRPGGMGLGLAIVESVVRAHRGTIRVEDRPGGGACFRVTLPEGGSA